MDEMSRLPYRTTGEDLKLLLESVGKGRDFEQLERMFDRSRTFQATIQAAQQLGFLRDSDQDEIALTERGKQFARGDRRKKSDILLTAMLEFEPYDLLLDWAFGKDNPDVTKIDRIETWWGTGGFGSSQTNIKEGSTAFAKYVEFAGLGEYKQGRKGYPSRIEWTDDAKQRIKEEREDQISDNDAEKQGEAEPKSKVGDSTSSSLRESPNIKPQNEPTGLPSENNELTLNFDGGRKAYLSIPPVMNEHEKKRLIKMVQLIVEVQDKHNPQENPSHPSLFNS